jgi:hypothetical protein
MPGRYRLGSASDLFPAWWAFLFQELQVIPDLPLAHGLLKRERKMNRGSRLSCPRFLSHAHLLQEKIRAYEA